MIFSRTVILKVMLVLALGPPLWGRAEAAFISFDTDPLGNPINAPTQFINATPLTELYASLGVHFSGPSINNGGAILHQASAFGVPARSGSNFLAFNRRSMLRDGGLPTDPETITFDTPMALVSIFASGGSESNAFRMQAFDSSGTLVATDIQTSSVGNYVQLSVSAAPVIRRVTIQGFGTDFHFVFDDLTFEPAGVAVPEPASLSLLGLSALALVGYGWRRKRTS